MKEAIRVEARQSLLHILRNPSGWSEEAVHDVRNRAAGELERLWMVERQLKIIASDLFPLVFEPGEIVR